MQHWQPGDTVVLRYTETPTSARMVHAYMGDPAGTNNNQPFLVNGRIVTVQARPYRVIQHTDDVVALFQPAGTLLPRWVIDEGRYLDNTQHTRVDSIRLLFPGHHHDATLFFEAAGEPAWFLDPLFEGEGMTPGWRERRRGWEHEDVATAKTTPGRFRGWYINLQSSPVFRPYGFDIVDHLLDIVVRPDGSWYWKDEDELQMALDAGACTPAQAGAIRRAGEAVVSLIEANAPPFDDTWTRWYATNPHAWPAIESFPDGWQTEPALLPGDGPIPDAPSR